MKFTTTLPIFPDKSSKVHSCLNPAWVFADLSIRSYLSNFSPVQRWPSYPRFFAPFLLFLGVLRVNGKPEFTIKAIFGFARVLLYASMSFCILSGLVSFFPSANLLNAPTVLPSSAGSSCFTTSCYSGQMHQLLRLLCVNLRCELQNLLSDCCFVPLDEAVFSSVSNPVAIRACRWYVYIRATLGKL